MSSRKNEKRRSERLDYREKVKFGNRFPENIGYSENLSEFGLVLNSKNTYSVGSFLLLKIYNNKEYLISPKMDKSLVFEIEEMIGLEYSTKDNSSLVGKVVWVKEDEAESKMGIEFISKSNGILAEYLKAKRSN